MTRDEARACWVKSGLTYDVLTRENVSRLQTLVDDEMKSSGCIRGTFRAGRCKVAIRAGKPWADIRCKAFYFKDRQAITFEPDGFVGFAGWADAENVQPVLSAFCTWVDEMAASTSARLKSAKRAEPSPQVETPT